MYQDDDRRDGGNVGVMRLRDWFAGEALASGQCPYPSDQHANRIRWAYAEADMALEIREAQEG